MSTKGSKRITESRVKNYVIGAGITGVPLAIALFLLIFNLGSMEVTGHSGSMKCGGDILCFAELNVTFKEDVFVYPMNATWMLETEGDEVEWIKLYRSWGSGWREIKLNETCKGTWCGGKKGVTDNAYVFAFREGKDYTLRFEAKKSKESLVHWSFNPEGEWFPIDSMLKDNCKVVTTSYDVKEPIIKWEIVVHKNETKENVTNITGYKTVTKFVNTTYCEPYAVVKGEQLNFTKQGYNCSESGEYLICDSCRDGNCDGICSPNGGESCVRINADGSIDSKNSVVSWDSKSAPLPVAKLEVQK